jgi:tRNA wybutosine-synthesizing protein 1
MLDDKQVKELKKKQYGLAGHAGVQICGWTKKVLQGREACYKEHFYGVHTHKCMEFSPSLLWCQNRCIYCWRPTELMKPKSLPKKLLQPAELVEALIEERRKLLSGFGGRSQIDLELWKDSLEPDHYAISLSGEPCIYPKLPELILYLKRERHARSVFLVTNGTVPGMLEELVKKKALPTQLYVSVSAPNERVYKRIANPAVRGAWKQFMRTIELLPALKVRKVLRFTLIKGLNDSLALMPEFAELFRRSRADFIELKAYMFLGYSRNRLRLGNMPLHKEVVSYSADLLEALDCYEYADEHEASRIVLLKNKRIKTSLIPFKEAKQSPD